MTKFLIAIVSTAFAISTMFTSAAQAGFKGRLAVGLAIGAIGVMAHQAHRHEQRKRWRKRHYVRRHKEKVYVSRKHKEKVYVSKKSTPKKAVVAKVEEPAVTPPLPVAKVIDAENENSSITTAAIAPDETAPVTTGSTEAAPEATVEPVAAAASETPKTANKLDCKKFFPSVGMTLTVPCE